LVLRRKDSAVTEIPLDATTYLRGEWIGNAQVVYNGTATQFDARSVIAGSNYYLVAFSYNGPAGYENYLATSPATGTVLAPAPNFGALYSGLDHNSSSFVDQLTTVMNPGNYFQVYYSNYATTMVNNFFVKDTVVNGEPLNHLSSYATLYL